jgi:hypothetical protein
MIAQALDKKGTSNTTTTNALQSGDFSKQLNEIDVSLKSIKSDTTKILEKQNTILEMQKNKKSDKNVIGESGDEKTQNNIKNGITMILGIAAAVLAIGLALKIVGKVDFLSVIGLGLAIMFIGEAFAKIGKLKMTVSEGMTTGKIMVIMAVAILVSSWLFRMMATITLGQAMTAILIAGVFTIISFGISKMIKAIGGANLIDLGKNVLFLPIILPAIALGIAMSSWFLKAVIPISFGQAITAILIAGVFTVISFGLAKMLKAIGGENIVSMGKNILFLPILLPAIALGIAMSSWVLQLVIPISLGQALTGILIAGMFTVIAYGLAKIITAIGQIEDPNKAAVAALMIPIILPAMAVAIAVSSWALQLVMPVSFSQFLTAVGISIVFIALSFSLKLILPVIGNLKNWQDVAKIPVLFTLLSVAITLSSWILSKAMPLDFMFMLKILAFAVVLAIAVVVLGIATYILFKIGLDPIKKGATAVLILAATVAAASLLIALGNYTNTPDWKWSLSTGLAIVIFGVAAYILTELGDTKTFFTGAISVLIIAGTIMATSKILSFGDYADGKYPDWKWSLGVGLSLLLFGTAALLLGALVLETGGGALVALVLGAVSILLVAGTILGVSLIFGLGKFDAGKNPSKAWAIGAVESILGFGLIAVAIAVFTPLIIVGAVAILAVAGTIFLLDKIFGVGKFEKFPNETWFKGATKTIKETGMIAVDLSLKLPLIVLGALSILAVAALLLGVDKIFKAGEFKKYPSKDWIDGVGTAITGFVKIMDDTSFLSVISGGIADFFGGGVSDVAEAIVKLDGIFSKGSFNSYPSANWIKSVSSTITGFSTITSTANKIGIDSILKTRLVTTGIVNLAKILSSGSRYFDKRIDPNYMSSVSKNIKDYMALTKSLNTMGTSNGLKSLIGLDPVSQAANGMIKMAGAYDKLATALKRFGGALQSIDGNKVNLIRKLTGNLAVLAALNKNAFENMLSTLENKASVFSKLLDVDNEKGKRPSVGDRREGSVATSLAKPKSKYGDMHKQMDMIISLLANINQSTSGVDEYIESKGKSSATADQSSQ